MYVAISLLRYVGFPEANVYELWGFRGGEGGNRRLTDEVF